MIIFILGWRFVLTRRQFCHKRLKTGSFDHTANHIPGNSLFILNNSTLCHNTVMTIIYDIFMTSTFHQADFLTNHNDQSLVEICITRLTSAIRETRSIELHAEPLVNLLETCLTYNLRPISGGPDPPHAKIASDVMSCIFLVSFTCHQV